MFEEINKEFELLITKTENLFNKINFNKCIEFELSQDVEVDLSKLDKMKGIYLFEIKNTKSLQFIKWIEGFEKKFKLEKNKYQQNWTPTINKSRIKKYNDNNTQEWFPLYLGKSENMKKRIHQHLYSNIGKAPSALKLIDRGTMIEEIFRISYINLCGLENYSIISPIIEKHLMSKVNPLVGR